MSIEGLISEINKRKELEVSKILSDAREEASKIRDKAKHDALEEYNSIIAKAESEAHQIDVREHSKAIIEAKHLMYDAISAKLADAEAKLQNGIYKYKKTESYAALLSKLYSKAIETLGKDCSVYVAKDDIPLIKKKGAKTNISEAPSSFYFGLYAQSADGKRVLDYGFSGIMSLAKNSFYSKLLKAINGSNE